MSISSQRLDLIPMTPAFLQTSLQGDLNRAAKLLEATLPAEWPENRRLLELRLTQLDADPTLEPWLLRAIVLRETHTMIGNIGFHTAPGPDYLEEYSPGAVEFGFGIDEPYRRQGYAREASLALMGWARDSHGVRTFILTISPDNIPSQNLAAQLGFICIGSHIDEVDGEEDILELKVE